MKPLSGLDSAFLYLESPEVPMHVGSLNLVGVPARQRAKWVEKAREHIGRRLHLAPVLTRRLATLPFDLASPVWVEDREVDLGWHVRRVRLPKPGTQAQLEKLVAKLHAEPLDRSRPLWRFYLVEGLASGDLAWYSKVHHAALDGAAGVQLAQALLDTTAIPRKVPKPPARTLDETPGVPALLGVALRKSAGEVGKLVGALPDVYRLLKGTHKGTHTFSPGEGDGHSGGRGKAAAARHSDAKVSVPFSAREGVRPLQMPMGPATRINVAITAERRYATVSIPLAEVKAIAKRHGAKLNDVVLALVSGALRRYLAHHGAVPRKPLVAAVPVSLRAEGDTAYSTRATMVLANLATHLPDPLERLAAIRASAGKAKALTGAAKSVIPTDFVSIGAPWLLAAAAKAYGYTQGLKAWTPLANVIVSNIPGPQEPLFFAGGRIRTYWPVSIVTHGLGLNVTVESYCGSLDFGLLAATVAMPDLDRFSRALVESHEELRALPRPPARRP
ncbi:MAG: wax ester/triacylglycerol synthase family O-acyltransferase [Betaproteobacteria bacterium]|nr:wax ester/triacylglycerol synthase family O-acyltransferase [Betaproteobacteria bacterium]